MGAGGEAWEPEGQQPRQQRTAGLLLQQGWRAASRPPAGPQGLTSGRQAAHHAAHDRRGAAAAAASAGRRGRWRGWRGRRRHPDGSIEGHREVWLALGRGLQAGERAGRRVRRAVGRAGEARIGLARLAGHARAGAAGAARRLPGPRPRPRPAPPARPPAPRAPHTCTPGDSSSWPAQSGPPAVTRESLGSQGQSSSARLVLL